jgi:hypothetical protein
MIKFRFNTDHFGRDKQNLWPTHGPQTWPRWRLFAMHFCECNAYVPRSKRTHVVWRLWIYTRIGAIHIDVAVKQLWRRAS